MSRLGFALLLLMVAADPARAEQVTLALPTGSTLTAEFRLPQPANKVPAVIFLHGLAVRDGGPDAAASRGHDIDAFAEAFARAGYAALVPIRTTPVESDNGDLAIDEGVSAVLGGMEFLQSRNEVDAHRIAVAGFGEGATIALWAAARMPDVGAAVAISPRHMEDRPSEAETQSLEKFLASGAVAGIRAPVLLLVGEDQSRADHRVDDELAATLMKNYKRFRYIKNYPGDRRWFEAPRADYMEDVIRFLDERMRRGGDQVSGRPPSSNR